MHVSLAVLERSRLCIIYAKRAGGRARRVNGVFSPHIAYRYVIASGSVGEVVIGIQTLWI
jgi:hypothetical protein